MLEDTDSGQLEDIDVIPNEEMLLVHKNIILMKPNFLPLNFCFGKTFMSHLIIYFSGA